MRAVSPSVYRKKTAMDMLLTSFGLSHLAPEKESLFYRLPPYTLSLVNRQLMSDFSMLLLCDKVIVDRQSFNRLMDVGMRDHWRYADIYTQTSELLRVLYDEGFVRLEDFEGVIESYRPLLEEMLELECKSIDVWVPPLRESVALWKESFNRIFDAPIDSCFPDSDSKEELNRRVSDFGSYYAHGLCYIASEEFVDEALKSSRSRRKSNYRQALIATLKIYLAYINANIVLTRHFDCSFHDWSDMRPFYQTKFTRIGIPQPPNQVEIEKLNCLFDVSFPEFTFWRPHAIVRALRDSRITELRKLVVDATRDETTFDKEFANRVLSEVLTIERKVANMRNIVSYATMPLGFIPIAGTPIQKLAEEVVMKPLERKLRKKFNWFYLISEMANHAEVKGNRLKG